MLGLASCRGGGGRMVFGEEEDMVERERESEATQIGEPRTVGLASSGV
jgi:hypothetical protein